MEKRTAQAFAPAAISNFFAIHNGYHGRAGPSDLSNVGATGGGFTLSEGVHTRVTVVRGSETRRVTIRVNGNPRYKATTTRLALRMLVDSSNARFSSMYVDQVVGVPIGYGFGASAASALSAVLAAASALEVGSSRERIAYFAHAAEIICQTGLGTVSSTYRNTGAGVITKAGAPGTAEFLRVATPASMRVVTASFAVYKKSDLLLSPSLRDRVNRLGGEALRSVLRKPSIRSLVSAGEKFSAGLGLQTRSIRELLDIAKSKGVLGASQNMVGYSVHAVAPRDTCDAVASAFASHALRPRVDIFRIGARPTMVLDSA
jgi:pantoate kinase